MKKYRYDYLRFAASLKIMKINEKSFYNNGYTHGVTCIFTGADQS